MTRSTPRRTFPRQAAALVLAATLALSACGDDGDGSADPAAEPTNDVESSQTTGTAPDKSEEAAGATLDVVISGDDVSPSGKAINMAVGDTLTIQITSDREGELHVHSSPEQEIEFKKGESRHDIQIDKPGQVDVEEHESDALIARLLVQ